MDFVKAGYQHSEITGKLIGAAFEVHKILGCGFSEFVYQRALEVEFRLRQVPFVPEKEMTIYYKNERVGGRRIDFLVNNIIPVEIKATQYLKTETLLNQ
jgi:GxxExxY protein